MYSNNNVFIVYSDQDQFPALWTNVFYIIINGYTLILETVIINTISRAYDGNNRLVGN